VHLVISRWVISRWVIRRWLALVVALMLVWGLGACDLPQDEPEPEGRLIDTSSLLAGDCVWRPRAALPVWGKVNVVDCSGGNWHFKVVNRVHIDGVGPLPDDDGLSRLAGDQCGPGWTSYLAPSAFGWAEGYRWMLCFADQVQPDA
jgi:hypothetical protein